MSKRRAEIFHRLIEEAFERGFSETGKMYCIGRCSSTTHTLLSQIGPVIKEVWIGGQKMEINDESVIEINGIPIFRSDAIPPDCIDLGFSADLIHGTLLCTADHRVTYRDDV